MSTRRHLTMCQSCIFRWSPAMLTGYVDELRCYVCGRTGECALTYVDGEVPEAPFAEPLPNQAKVNDVSTPTCYVCNRTDNTHLPGCEQGAAEARAQYGAEHFGDRRIAPEMDADGIPICKELCPALWERRNFCTQGQADNAPMPGPDDDHWGVLGHPCKPALRVMLKRPKETA